MKINTISHEAISDMLNGFVRWGESVQFKSYDWWDLWGFPYGRWAKTLYFKNKFLGAFAVLPVFVFDILFPDFRQIFVQKRQFPISIAQIALGFVHLYKATKNKSYLEKAEALVPKLIELGYHNDKYLGWGIKHEWTTLRGIIPSGTCCHTQTCYGYELFVELYELTHNNIYKEYLAKIANHTANNFPEWQDGDQLISAYFTINDGRRVINANAYRAYMLIEAGIRFHHSEYLNKGLATIRYILSKQNKDGSFPYSEDQPFIDGFHTCFVLKNLHKVSLLLPDTILNIANVVNKGLDYYAKCLINQEGYPVPFSVNPHFLLYKYDAYDFAECIGLMIQTKQPREKILHILNFIQKNFYSSKGWFAFRLFVFWKTKGIPYMRSANSAMFLALSKFLEINHS